MPQEDDVTNRLDAFEARLAALEAGAQPRAAGAGTFWALEGLRAHGAGAPAVLYTGLVDLPGGEHAEWQMDHAAADLLAAPWEERAAALTALAHPARLGILQRVARGEARTAAELAGREDTGTTGQVYHHLRQLVAAGWLRPTGHGRHEVPATRVVALLVILAAASPGG